MMYYHINVPAAVHIYCMNKVVAACVIVAAACVIITAACMIVAAACCCMRDYCCCSMIIVAA